MIELVPKQNRTSVLSKIGLLRRRTEQFAQAEQTLIGEEFVDIARVYPPETEANNPPPVFYTRGVGKIGSGGNIIEPSQNLGASWSVTHNNGVTAINNTATYAPHVHGTTRQAWFHTLRGWLTIRKMLEKIGIIGDENSPVIIDQKHPRFLSVKSRLARVTRGIFDF